MRFITTPCVLHKATGSGTKNAHGKKQASYTDVDTFCALEQRDRTEQADQGENSDTLWTVFFLAGTDMGDTPSASKVTVKGVTYEFDGDPWELDDMPSVAHIEATARRAA